MKLLPIWVSIVFLVLGVLFIAAGVVIFFIAPGLIESKVIEGGVIDSPSHSGFEEWRKPPENPLVYTCYFWNISNIHAVRNGTKNGNTKPFLELAGPYVYKRFQERFDVRFLEEDGVTECSSGCPKVEYKEWGDYVYYPEESDNRDPEEDPIYVPNVAYWTFLISANAKALPNGKISEEIMAVEGGRARLFGGFVTSFTNLSELNALGFVNMNKFSLNFFNGVGPLLTLGAIVSTLNGTFGVPAELAKAAAVFAWAYCAQSEDLTVGGSCPYLTGFLAAQPTYEATIRTVLNSFTLFRFNANTTESDESFAVFSGTQLNLLWNSSVAFSLANPAAQSDWLNSTKVSTVIVPTWVGVYGLTVPIASRIASWRGPSPTSFGSGLFALVEGTMQNIFFPGGSYPGTRSAWGFLHWGRWNVPDLTSGGFGNGGILGGTSITQADPVIASQVFNQKLEINLWANDVGLTPENFNYTLSRKILETFAASTPSIYGHIAGFEGLIAATGSEVGAASIWPGPLNPLQVPTADPSYSLTGNQARILYNYLKIFFLKNIVDPTILGGLSMLGQFELPNALFKTTPYAQLFGRTDPLFTFLTLAGFPIPSTFVPGVWTDFSQATVDSDPLALDKFKTGKDDPKNKGQQLTYETKEDLGVEKTIIGTVNATSPKYYDISVPVRGSSLTFVGPFRLVDNKNDDNLLLWVPNVVRELKLIFQKERTLKGIPVNRYIADRFYQSVVASTDYINPYNFVMNLRRAYTLDAVDIFLTFPHFTLVEETNLFVDPLDGDLEPNEEEYILFWDIEPITGLAFAARAPLQVAVATLGNSWNASMSAFYVFDRWSKDTTRNTYFPVYYITRTNELTDDQAQEWKDGVKALMDGRLAALAAGVAFGAILLVVGLIFLILKSKASKGDMDEFELRT